MKVFITGPTGLIGKAVTRRFLAAGHSITGLARSDDGAQRCADAGVAVHRGDVQDPDSLAAGARDADAVVHISVGGPRGVTEIDVVAFEAMAGALAGRNGHMLFTSGLGVYAGNQASFVDEETPIDNPAPSQAARVALENQVRAAAARGVRTVVMRPANVYGHGQTGMFTRMQLDYATRAGAGAYVGDGIAPYAVVHVDDLAEAYLAALEHGQPGSVYNIVGATLPTREVAAAMGHAVGAAGRTVSLTLEEASAAWGPLAGALARGPLVAAIKATLELRWSPRAPSLTYELIHGSLRRVSG